METLGAGGGGASEAKKNKVCVPTIGPLISWSALGSWPGIETDEAGRSLLAIRLPVLLIEACVHV